MKVQLTDKNLSPAITDEDQEFAVRISKEYKKIPLNEIRRLTSEVRNYIQNGIPGFTEVDLVSPYKEYVEMLFPSDAEIINLSITTDKGTVKIKNTDSFFKYFTTPIQRMRAKFYKEQNYLMKILESQVPFDSIRSYMETTPLGAFQKRVVIGMFICHFKIGKHVMTEQEFKTDQEHGENPIETQSYKRYLSDIVKSRLNFFD